MGRLKITDQRIHFKPLSTFTLTTSIEIPLAQVTESRPFYWIRPITNGIVITTKAGEVYRFQTSPFKTKELLTIIRKFSIPDTKKN